MTRIERKREEKNKKLAKRSIYRRVFLITMVCIISGCVFLVDKEANLMIGKIETYNIQVFVKNLNDSFMKTAKDMEKKLSKLNNLR